MDFYQRFDKKATSKKLVKVGRITSFVVLLIAIIWAPFIQHFDSLVAYYQEVVSYLAPPIVGTFFLGLFWKRSNQNGAFWGLVSGLLVAGIVMALKYIVKVDMNIHFLLLAPMILVFSVVVNILISLCSQKPDPLKVAENTWTTKTWRDETIELKGTKWYKNHRILSAILVLACFAMYFMFI